MSERRRWLLIAIAYVAVLFLLFWRTLAQHRVCGWDALDEYWPDLVFQSRSLQSGELPLWNPYTLGGYSFFADPQAGVLTPVNWICVAVSTVFGVGAYLVQLKIMLLFYAALLGMHVLAWRWTKRHDAAALAAITFVVGAPLLVHKNSALIWPLLQLPWAFVAFDAFCVRPTLRRGALLGAATAVVIVTHPQGGFYSALLLASYALYVAVERTIAERRAALRRLVAMAPGLACALAVAAIWIGAVYIPAWHAAAESARAERTVAWAISDAIPKRALRELFVPALDSNWMHDIYLGPHALIALVWFAIVDARGRLWLGVAAVSVAASLGKDGHVLPWLVMHVPGFSLFRIAYRYKLLTAFAGAAASAGMVAHLARMPLARWQRYALLAVCMAWLGITWFGVHAVPGLTALLVIATLWGAALSQGWRKYWLVALVAVSLLDLWRAAGLKLSILQPQPDADRGSALLSQMPGVDRDWRVYVERYAGSGGTLPIPYHASYVYGAREISGFEQPLTSKRMLDVLAMARGTPALLTHFNTKYFVGVVPPHATRLPGTPAVVASDVAPVARLYSHALELSSKEVLDHLSRTTPGALDAALVEPGTPHPALPAGTSAPVDGTLVDRGLDHLAVDVVAPFDGILVVNEVWAPGWTATLDGRSAEVFRVNYLLRGLVVPAGHHRVELRFRVAPANGAGAVTIAILAIVSAICIFFRAPPRRRT